jgi:HK97 gp10 family phage protein
MEFAIEIKGLEKMASLYDKAPQIVEPELRKALQKAVIILQGAAREFTPVDTGRLRQGHGVRIGAFEAAVFNPVNYGLYVHEGTKRMKARPFYKNAIERESGNINGIFEQHVNNILKQL